MSGFVAAFENSLPSDIHSLVDAMSAFIEHRGETDETDNIHKDTAISTRSYTRGVYRAIASSTEERTVIFDGMLFNEVEICRTAKVDTVADAIWEGFQRYGDDWFARLDGAFAIVIHDRRRNAFHLARDLFGHRPLVFATLKDTFLCGSEIKPFFAHERFNAAVNEDMLLNFLHLGLVPGPQTLIKDVYKCLPGQVCHVRDGRMFTHSLFYRPSPTIDHGRTLEDVEAFASESLTNTIRGYRRRRENIGVLLSGGIDSTLLAGKLAAENRSSAYAVSFGASNWADDESRFAEEAAQQLGIRFDRAQVDESFDVLCHLQRAVWHIEEPTRFENAIALEVALSSASGKTDGILTGEGGDAFFGDSMHQMSRRFRAATKLPRPVRRLVGRLCGLMQDQNFASVRQYTKKLQKYAQNDTMGQLVCGVYSLAPSLTGIYNPYSSFEHLRVLDSSFRDLTSVQAINLIDLLGFSHCWIERMEKIGAAHGVDVLHPFQRNEVLEFSLTTPYHLMVQNRGKLMKPALRRMAAKEFGREVAYRPKKQLAAPMKIWLDTSDDLRRSVLDLQSEDRLFRAYLEPTRVDAILKDFEANGASNVGTRRAVFVLLSFEIWLHEFCAARPTAGHQAQPWIRPSLLRTGERLQRQRRVRPRHCGRRQGH